MLMVLDPNDRHQPFPDVSEALAEPNGLLAVGGCLSPGRLEIAYRSGIFPWFGHGEPILWWSPDPRMVLVPDEFRISRSLRKTLRKTPFTFSYDRQFEAVLTACAGPRKAVDGTWITEGMMSAYVALHRLGKAHSFEVCLDGQLVGGLYGVAIGQVFYGESMFHRVTDASKAAMAFAVEKLRAWGVGLIDCQMHTDHLSSLGARPIRRGEFIDLLGHLCQQPTSVDAWAQEGR